MVALGTFLIAFLLSYFGTLALLKLRIAHGFIDVPNERSSHEAPKSRIGGIAIVVSFYAAIFYLFAVVPETRSFVPLTIGVGMLFLTGVLDDWRGLGVRVRFGMQIIAALTVAAFGLVLDQVHVPGVGTVQFGWFSVPITVLFIIGSINFYNFIDGIDGLAAGSAFFASGFLSLIAMLLGHPALALVYLALAGCSIGFLQFNFPPSRLFMGDSGSTFLGFFFACTAVMGNRLSPGLPVFVPLLILSSLYLDAGLTLVNRLLKKENIFRAHHTHYYQRLLSLGLNHKQVTLLEYGLIILLGISAIVYFKAGGYFPIFLSACWVVLFTATILKIRGLERGDTLFWEKRTLFAIGVDLMLITVAYLGAYFLRMNFRFTASEGNAVLHALPIVLVVRSACFFKFGLYRSVWKYTSTADIVRIIKAVTMGSAIILTAVVLLYRFVAFPRTLFIIEYFLLIVFVMGSRFSFRLFHEIGKEAQGVDVRRFGIIGAGDYGERIGRELRSSESKDIAVDCFIDDDKNKIGLTLQGVSIVGPISALKEICAERKLDGLVLGTSKIDSGKMREIIRGAKTAGVPLEGQHSALSKKPEPTHVLFDRLFRGLGRQRSAPNVSANVFYRGKDVLVTQGGERIGPALIRELLRLGASVTVQIDTPGEVSRIDESLRSEIDVYLGPIRGVVEARAMLEAAAPDVVFYCLTLDIEQGLNVEDYLWDTVVLRTKRMCDALPGSGVSSFVALSFWGNVAPGESAANAGAVADALVLNSLGSRDVDPKIVRFPRILNEHTLRRLYDGSNQRSLIVRNEFDILEPDAVSLALNCAAAEPHEAIMVPEWHRSILSSDVGTILMTGKVGRPATANGQSRPSAAGPIFPVERAVSSATPGSCRLSGPIYPLSDDLKKVLSSEFVTCPQNDRADWLRLITSGLYQIMPGSKVVE